MSIESADAGSIYECSEFDAIVVVFLYETSLLLLLLFVPLGKLCG